MNRSTFNLPYHLQAPAVPATRAFFVIPLLFFRWAARIISGCGHAPLIVNSWIAGPAFPKAPISSIAIADSFVSASSGEYLFAGFFPAALIQNPAGPSSGCRGSVPVVLFVVLPTDPVPVDTQTEPSASAASVFPLVSDPVVRLRLCAASVISGAFLSGLHQVYSFHAAGAISGCARIEQDCVF